MNSRMFVSGRNLRSVRSSEDRQGQSAALTAIIGSYESTVLIGIGQFPRSPSFSFPIAFFFVNSRLVRPERALGGAIALIQSMPKGVRFLLGCIADFEGSAPLPGGHYPPVKLKRKVTCRQRSVPLQRTC